MYSAARVNEFEMKGTYIEFVIVSRQGNNLMIKLIFCEINDSTPGFCLVLSETYS